MVIVRKSVRAVGAVSSPYIQVSPQNPLQVGFAVIMVSGSNIATVEHTFDDVNSSAEPVWFPNAYVVGVTANADGNYDKPITAIRVTNTDTGTVSLTINQYV